MEKKELKTIKVEEEVYNDLKAMKMKSLSLAIKTAIFALKKRK